MTSLRPSAISGSVTWKRGVVLHCVCQLPASEADVESMLECASCHIMFHFDCLHLPPRLALQYQKENNYWCSLCTESGNGSTAEPEHRALAGKQYCNYSVMLKYKIVARDTRLWRIKDGHKLTIDLLERVGFSTPIVIDRRQGLGIEVPPDTMRVSRLGEIVGSTRKVELMDVPAQMSVTGRRWTFGDWTQYFEDEAGRKRVDDMRIYNMISLEFTDTPLAEHVTPPSLVRKTDLVSRYWDFEEEKPARVFRYFLMGMAGSYTDWHFDFGGSSVWYHVWKGCKVFYFAPPTPYNFKVYGEWFADNRKQQDPSIWLGDHLEGLFVSRINQGETVMIPSGWLHAVYTPVDSIVFGGNFLHHFSLKMQMECFALEKSWKMHVKYQFPAFAQTMWYTLRGYLRKFLQLDLIVSPAEKSELPVFLDHLRAWLKRASLHSDDAAKAKKVCGVPKAIDDPWLEISQVEKFLPQLIVRQSRA
eukprot:GFYU01007858.1.p1 GENE.GFYU01007858.1~~GFYU01007858.1.p1  ORF type:complete len:474 (-),score=97.54 GFYU01007858.1:181-1602(-)